VKLEKLREELELRLKVEIHEIEERKNQHINDLMKNHEDAFREMKEYYNDITRENLELIKMHKEKLIDIRAQIETNQKTVDQLKQKMEELERPLAKARHNRDILKKQLATFDKDVMALRNAKARLQVLKKRVKDIKVERKELEEKFLKVEKEKEDMYRKYEMAIEQLRQRTDYKNQVLDDKQNLLQNEYERKEVQLQELVQRSGLDQRTVEDICKKMEEAIEAKNSILRNLKYSLAHATKAYNDAIRVYEAKLVEFGIPAEELGLELLETNTSNMPAGLVAA
jgi:chromosome segregation ATPase